MTIVIFFFLTVFLIHDIYKTNQGAEKKTMTLWTAIRQKWAEALKYNQKCLHEGTNSGTRSATSQKPAKPKMKHSTLKQQGVTDGKTGDKLTEGGERSFQVPLWYLPRTILRLTVSAVNVWPKGT